MVRAGRSSVALAVALAGCSLITPLDFVGGTAGAPGSGGSDAGTGGSSGGRGGTAGKAGGGGAGKGATGGTGAGGKGGSGGGGAGQGGEGAEGGEAGDGGQGGDGEGGTGGKGGNGGGGLGGRGGRGGAGGAGGAGAGGTAGGGTAGGGTGGMTAGTSGGGCAGADLGSDAMHCGTCTTVCGASDVCIDGICVSSPCEGLCDTWVTVPLVGDGYRWDNVGTAAQCFEVIGYERSSMAPALVCWNFVSPPRTLSINGVASSCMTEPGVSLPAQRAGGYCVQVSAGDHSYAGFKFPLP